jgi:hypothetical protein
VSALQIDEVRENFDNLCVTRQAVRAHKNCNQWQTPIHPTTLRASANRKKIKRNIQERLDWIRRCGRLAGRFKP